MRNTATIILAVVGLATGCESRYRSEYILPSDRPEAIAAYKLERLDSGVRHVGWSLDVSELKYSIRDLESGLPERYRDVDDSYDIAARTTKKLMDFKAQHSSLQATLQDFDRELAAIKRYRGELSSYQIDRLVKLGEESADHRQELVELGESLVQLENQIKLFNERYLVDRKRYIVKKNKYREHLLKVLAANSIPDDHIYIDNDVLLYVDSARITKDTVTACLKAYLIMPRLAGSTPRISSDAIFAYNARDEHLGSPIDVSSTKHKESAGVTVVMTYQDDASLGPGHLKLMFGQSALTKGLIRSQPVLIKEDELIFVIPYDRKEAAPPTLPQSVTKGYIAKTERDFVEEIKTIACKKEGDHLIVPVSLNIHGKSVEAEMMFDTGASMTTVPMKLYLKGNAKPLSALRRDTFVTASRVIQSYIDEIEVATSAYSRTSTVAISDYDIPLLGANYFQGNVFTVDVENECIYVHPRAR